MKKKDETVRMVRVSESEDQTQANAGVVEIANTVNVSEEIARTATGSQASGAQTSVTQVGVVPEAAALMEAVPAENTLISPQESNGGQPEEHRPAAKILSKQTQCYGHLLEAQHDKTGKTWDVVLIEAGESKNGILYTEELLQSAVPLFEGARAYAYEFSGKQGQLFDHMPETVRERLPEGATKNLVGDYSNVRFGEFRRDDGAIGKGLLAKFHVTASWLRDTMNNAWDAGRKSLIGFSIDALAKVRDVIVAGGRTIKEALSFERLDEVTIVSYPGAGGIILSVAESIPQRIKENLQMEKLWAYLKENFAKYLEGVQVDETKLTESTDVILGIWEKINKDLKIAEAAKSAMPAASALEQNSKAVEPEKPAMTMEQMQTHVQTLVESVLVKRDQEASESKSRQQAARNLLETKLKESNLPDYEQNEVRELYGDMLLTESEINRVISKKQIKLDAMKNAGAYFPNQVRESSVQVKAEEYDKLGDALEGMLLSGQTVNNVPPFHSLHESYRKITGFYGPPAQMGVRIMNDIAHSTPPMMDLYSTESYREALNNHIGRLRESRVNAQSTRLQENVLQTSMFAELLSDRQYKVMLRAYNNQDFQDWRKIVSQISSVSDFKTQRRVRTGGFADLSTVAELGTYSEFTWPADEEVTYTVGKYGNLAPLSMEAVRNDDLRVLQNIPKMIGNAAARTLYKFVFDFLRNPPTMGYDSTALFHATHGNLGATALSDSALQTRMTAMGDQTELSSGEVIVGLRPKYIVVPNELERTSWEITTATVSQTSSRAETVENWYSRFGLIPIRVQYWSDANDWCLVADPTQWDTIEVAFLDGRQEPEFFIADAPAYGATLTADQITYKVRFIFGGSPLDHRTLDKSVVA